MAIGTYATNRPSTVSPSDIEVYYTYTPSREAKPTSVGRLDASQVVEAVEDPIFPNSGIVVGGLYNITLPSNVFNKKGIYTVSLRPKRILGRIEECGILASLPDVKGLVINPDDFPDMGASRLANGGLVGFRVDYLDSVGNGRKAIRDGHFTVVTWSNKCETTQLNIGNSTQKSKGFRFADSGDRVFLTVTPSTSPSVRANQLPDIGVAGQEIMITNPFFDPYTFEVELTEYDMESLAVGLYGDQTRSIEDGVVTWYKRDADNQNQIYKQAVLSVIKDEYNKTLFEIQEGIDAIDDSKEWDVIQSDLE